MRSDFHRDPTFFSVVGAPYVAERHNDQRRAQVARAQPHPGRLEFLVIGLGVTLIALAVGAGAQAIHHVF